jgi:hypothetical protein
VPSISADDTTNGIVWDAQVDGFFTGSPAILRAYDANDLSTPLYASNQVASRDTAGGAVKFTTPTVANGMVYLGTQFEVDAYGLLPLDTPQQGNVLETNLVSDLPGVAQLLDSRAASAALVLAQQQFDQYSRDDPPAKDDRSSSGAVASARNAMFADLASLATALSRHDQQMAASPASGALQAATQDSDQFFAAGGDFDR